MLRWQEARLGDKALDMMLGVAEGQGDHGQALEVVRVLPEWSFPLVTGWAVFPGRRLMPAKTRAFLDLMEEMYQTDAPV